MRFLKTKGEVLSAFKEYKALVENLRDKKIKYLRTTEGNTRTLNLIHSSPSMELREDFRYRITQNRTPLNERTGHCWILRDVFYCNRGCQHLFRPKQFQPQATLGIGLQTPVSTIKLRYGQARGQMYLIFRNLDARRSA